MTLQNAGRANHRTSKSLWGKELIRPSDLCPWRFLEAVKGRLLMPARRMALVADGGKSGCGFDWRLHPRRCAGATEIIMTSQSSLGGAKNVGPYPGWTDFNAGRAAQWTGNRAAGA